MEKNFVNGAKFSSFEAMINEALSQGKRVTIGLVGYEYETGFIGKTVHIKGHDDNVIAETFFENGKATVTVKDDPFQYGVSVIRIYNRANDTKVFEGIAEVNNEDKLVLVASQKCHDRATKKKTPSEEVNIRRNARTFTIVGALIIIILLAYAIVKNFTAIKNIIKDARDVIDIYEEKGKENSDKE